MNETNFISFVLGAFTLFVGILIQPQIQRLINGFKRVLTYIKPKSREVSTNDIDARLTRLERLWDRRENDRKNKVQKQVLEYLKELQNVK